MDDLTDEQLFDRYRRGDTSAFEQLYRRYRGGLFRYLLGTCPSRAEAEECYQELWSRVIVARDRFRDGSLRAWLYRIARNLQIDTARRQRLQLVGDPARVDEAASPAPDMARQQHLDDCGDRLHGEIAGLPAEQREAFLLKEETGLSLEQIAELAAVGRETIKSRLRYALRRLREALEDCL